MLWSPTFLLPGALVLPRLPAYPPSHWSMARTNIGQRRGCHPAAPVCCRPLDRWDAHGMLPGEQLSIGSTSSVPCPSSTAHVDATGLRDCSRSTSSSTVQPEC